MAPAGYREPLYRRVLGDAWDRLPEPIQRMHVLNGTMAASGLATVERGHSFLARLIAWVFRFPKAGRNVPVKVTFTALGAGELWTRDFAGSRFSSFQQKGVGRSERLVGERFGPFAFALAAVLEQDRLLLIPRGWSLFGLPLPTVLAPFGNTFEHVDDEGRFAFHVEVCVQLAGVVVRYRGYLIPDVPSA